MTTAPGTGELPADMSTTSRRGTTRRTGFGARLIRKPVAMIALVYLALIVIGTIFAGVLAPYGAEHQELSAALTGPSGQHWLGAGELGKDVFSRILYGGRVTLLGVLTATGVFAVIGVPAGMVAGYRRGRFDRFVLKSADLLFAIPVMIVLLVVLAIFPGNETAAMAAMGLLAAPGLARVVRSVTLGVREELYVRAAVSSGLSDRVIIVRHVLPKVTGTALVQISTFAAGAVLMETGLGFLGVGTTTASWGNLVAEASRNLGVQPWLLVPSGFIIITFIIALNLAADGVRDALAERYQQAPASSTRPRRRTLTTTVGQQARVAVAGDSAITEPAAGPPPTDVLLAVRDLTVTVPIDDTPTDLIRGVSFDVRPGEAVGLVGESGCGKTVTAASILGLLPVGGRISTGQVWFDGTDLTTVSSSALRAVRRSRIGWISQDPIASLDPSFTAGSQVAEAVRRATGCGRATARQRALELFERVRLPQPDRVAKSYPHQLSGGMAQRIGIAAALAGGPELVIADEPTTALDVTVQAEILELLRDLQHSGTAVVLITHDWGVLADLCERAVVMYAGETVERADVRAMVRGPLHPYTAGLLRSDPHRGVRGQPLPALPGSVPQPTEWPVGCHFQNRCPLVIDACRAAPIPLVEPTAGRTARCVRTGERFDGRSA
ncbi:MAG: dipeptide/oligopeptide/nickel ABC transporter permease/ATP-binding protein [Nocardioides sp.]|uniref:dipeptide/oligopeptide/nickel ABC transporter permease/ATP-binding protein n=1 Tax=Nocardioides sp. TaxID=35761 RepID=UPI0039E2EDEA